MNLNQKPFVGLHQTADQLNFQCLDQCWPIDQKHLVERLAVVEPQPTLVHSFAALTEQWLGFVFVTSYGLIQHVESRHENRQTRLLLQFAHSFVGPESVLDDSFQTTVAVRQGCCTDSYTAGCLVGQ